MREWLFKIKVRKLIIKISVLIIAHFNHFIFYTKGVAKVRTRFVMMHFHDPILEITTIKQLHHLVLSSFFPTNTG